MVYSLKALTKAYTAGEKFDFLFFWGHTPPKDGSINHTCFSQWWMCTFVVNDVSYCCAEQFMMAEKARLFQDEETLSEILKSTSPANMKALGRKVKGFEANLWEEKRYCIVKTGNIAKFSQNPDLWEFLKQTKNQILVEASPYDRIWGIGMEKSNPNVENPLKWKGQNLLGFALTQVRDTLLEKEENE